MKWISDDETIATVDSNGNITGVGYGTTTIHVVSTYDETIECSIEVKVIRKKIMSNKYVVDHDQEEAYTYGAEPITIIKDYLKAFENEEENLHVYDIEGNEVDKETGIASTFMKIKLIIEDKEYDEVTIVIKGDVTGDGYITMTDFIKIKKKILKLIEYNFIETKAGDIAESDELITMTDFIKIKKYILKLIDTVN